MKWTKRILFTVIYLLVAFGLSKYSESLSWIMLIVAIPFSNVISNNSIFSGLGKYLYDKE